MNEITWDDFEKVELRVGTVIGVDELPEARKPALKLTVDFGDEIGIKRSSAQIADLYDAEGRSNCTADYWSVLRHNRTLSPIVATCVSR